MKCARCQHANEAGAKFCEECAAPLARVCAHCGHPLSATAKFCPECAHPAGRPETPPAVSRFGAPDSYTPKYLAERILTSKAAIEGERKQVTVLFADLRGSMEVVADRDPETARKLLDPVLEQMMEAVHRFDGTVNQVMGDGIMALFGAPLAHEDHAVRACYAALRMQESVKRYAEGVRRDHGVTLRIRVGLNSGEVVVRAIGNDLHMDYTAVGQTTHLAARMEQLADPGTVLITPDTLALAEGFVRVKPLGPIAVKGLPEPVPVFELTGTAAARTRLEAARARGFSPFVGRDAEIDRIRQAAEHAARGRGQIVAVVGEPGVGKSRLFYEFIHSHRTSGWLVLEASSVSYGKATPFLPVVDLLRRYLRIDERDDARTVRAKITGGLLTLDRALEDAVPALTWLFDALEPNDAYLHLDAAQRRRRAIESVKRVLLRESQVQPVLLVFEDLHWIDAETQEVLDRLVDGLPTTAVLLAVNYRPEYRHGWGGKTYYQQLRIDPLPPTSADELLATLLGTDASVRPLARLLIERTEGNPLFLEESVRALVETRALVGDPGAYRLLNPVTAIEIPGTVQAILAARIDRLPSERKRLLQAAAVIGKDVPVAVLEAIVDMSGSDVREALTELQTAEFLYEMRLFPDLEYTFKHALTHEVAYGSVLHDRRRALHAAIVEAIERLDDGRVSERVELLAHHAVRGGVTAKAVHYLFEAGKKALARSANREALEHFESALGALSTLPPSPAAVSQGLDIRIAMGPALIALKGASSPEVDALYQTALDTVVVLEDTSRRFPALWGAWYVRYTRGEYATALEAGTRLLEDAEAGGDSGRILEAHHAVWATLLGSGNPLVAVPHMERGMALYDPARHAAQTFLYGNHNAGACCRYQLSLAQWLLGYPDRASATARDALRFVDDLKHPLTTMIALWIIGCVQYLRGDRTALGPTIERQFALGHEHGFGTWMDSARVLLPVVRGERPGREALAGLHRYVQVEAASWRRVFVLCVLAELYVEAGDPDEGRRLLAEIDETTRQASFGPEVYRLEAELLLRSADNTTAEAERLLITAVDLARGRSQKSLELRAATSLARLWQRENKREAARRTLAPVYEWFTEGLETPDLQTARRLLAELDG
ncbi:MAG TPA: adenylate/guanylate cyclase domain-containing protein [Methylomirabilota bacterium]